MAIPAKVLKASQNSQRRVITCWEILSLLTTYRLIVRISTIVNLETRHSALKCRRAVFKNSGIPIFLALHKASAFLEQPELPNLGYLGHLLLSVVSREGRPGLVLRKSAFPVKFSKKKLENFFC